MSGRIRNLIVKPALLLALVAPLFPAWASGDEDWAQKLLMQALENQYRGRYHAKLEMVEENFFTGRDSLAGQAEFADDLGERRLILAGSRKSFEYRSLDFGREQWVVDGNSRRIRRIANRQWKKGQFGTLLTYEDMLKFPADFLLEYSSCKGISVSDSAYQISMTLKPTFQSFYSRLEVTLGKDPVLLKGLTFHGANGQKLKSMRVDGYQKIEGRWLASDLSLVDCDSTASLRMCLRNVSVQEMPVAKSDRKGGIFSVFSRLTDILSKGPEATAREQSDAEVDVNN